MTVSLFSIAFRPFFLGAAWLSLAWIGVWVALLVRGAGTTAPVPPMIWHGHEMLFGFTMAVIAGFVLTAAQNWTGRQSVTPRELTLLVGVWLAARVGFLMPWLVPFWLVSLVDLAFLPLLAFFVARTLVPARNIRNYMFIPLFGAFAVLNGVIHLDIHGVLPGAAMPALDVAILLVTVLLVFMGGRVIPFFTERWLPDSHPRQWPALNWCATLAVLLLVPMYLLGGRDPMLAPLLFAAAAFLLARWVAWRPWQTWRTPLLWILHLGYLWIPVGLVLLGASLSGASIGWSAGLHALMVGAMGSLCIGMMARVSLGHTGRPLVAPRLAVAGFALITLAALARLGVAFSVGLPWLAAASGLGWALAYLCFAVAYTPLLVRPRTT
ncbi:NnrS family protein [Aquisalimonas asiatica]|uniref:NnrS family protein n=1 Tax=Aquisalimonas asiatica TaxID=406100 RepID=UPI000B829387|nr:NnrS family protein [Aquisalimonas asiatica]